MASETARPLLLPQNRKVRHLCGIYFRNLSFALPRGHTTDDSALKRSPSKIESLRETSQLHHFASTDNLRPAGARRWSTNLGSATPTKRQQRLESAIDDRVADVFFSLHCEGEEEPIYVSEVIERASNFNFQSFELSEYPAFITRKEEVTVKVFTKRQATWTLHLEQEVDLRTLNFLGNLSGTQFPSNCLVFHLVDGIYTVELPPKNPPPKQGTALSTSSYNALMRLSTLGHSIQDALATQETLTAQINDLIANNKDPRTELPEAEDSLERTNKALATQERANEAAKEKVARLTASILERREKMKMGRALQEKTEQDIAGALEKLAMDKQNHDKVKDQIRGQRRRICEDLANIFNIIPVPGGKALEFQICGIALPNADMYGGGVSTGGEEDSLSAALNFVALLTNYLQYYLGVPLPYPITPFGSKTCIRDDISVLKDPDRNFPLYIPRGGSSAHYRFDYGWFLLNKDIEALCIAQGLKVVDIRHTLPNLKYLLYVCSAGTDELPERKKGGVRGLRAGLMRTRGVSLADDTGSIGSSRPGSADSDRSAMNRQRDNLGRLKNGGADRRGATSPSSDLPFEESEPKFSLRTKGMRENVSK